VGLFIPIVEKRKGGGKNEGVDGGKQTQQQDQFAFVGFRLCHDDGFLSNPVMT
jgi:hypothetical protein